MPVIIVGAGIGGLTAALALAQRGVNCLVLERADTLEEVGAGIQLSPNACKVLFALGFEAQIRRAAFAPDAIMVRSASDSRTLLANRLGAFAQDRWGAPYLQIRRSALQRILHHAARARDHVELRFTAEVTGLELTADHALVSLSNGEALAGSAVIGCDGLNSSVRAALWGATPARFTGHTAWRGLARAEALPMSLQTEPGVWTGPRKHFVHYPVGEGWVNMVAVMEADAYRGEGWTQNADRDALVRAFADWPSPVRALIAAVQSPWRSALFDRPSLAKWSSGRATLLGDAAHPILPFLAQGAAMAIEDAAVLANCIAATPEIPLALAAYETARRARSAKVQSWATRNGALFHLPDPMLTAAFGAASLAGRFAGRPEEARLDWLYGYDATTQNPLL
jgi:salicylate hydroxylase